MFGKIFNAIRNSVIDTKDGIEYQISDQGDNDKALGEKIGFKPSNRCQTRAVSDNMVIEDFNPTRLSESVIDKQKYHAQQQDISHYPRRL
ncbi:hypothetical protein H9Q74_008341 [Fusarium xylarioides]|nr:hypothetical protein H9Q71_008322 [Fusarium xylarioides]KAG5821327.1 hypothetical protein H9Q74_008341 [Fusarium xylarioides]